MLKKILLSIKNLRASHDDAKLNRVHVGTDRFGNRYYQYYNSVGKETRRILEPNPHASETFDPIWSEWLRNRQKVPFNEEQLKGFYDIEIMNKKSAFEYEVKDANMMKEFRKEYKKAQENEKTTMEKSTGQVYTPGVWKAADPVNIHNENKK